MDPMSEVRMNRRILGLLGVGAALVFTVAGCKGDPLSDADGTPVALTTSFTDLVVDVGNSVTFTAEVVDGRNTPLEVAITAVACDAKVTTSPDPDFNPVPATTSGFLVAGVTAGTSCVNLSGGGLQATVDVTVN
jgi:hypothetical protein